MGEQISLSLDFTRLTDAFDYRLNKCWATSPDTGDSKLNMIYFYVTCHTHLFKAESTEVSKALYLNKELDDALLAQNG